MKTIKKILLATDFSPEAGEALDKAVTLAQKLGSEIHVLHVVNPITDCVADYCLDSEEAEGAKNSVLSAARIRMDREIGRYSEINGLTITPDVRYGRTYDEILKAESDKNIDLLVIGPHNRKSFWKQMTTRLSDRLEKNLNVDTLMVHHTA